MHKQHRQYLDNIGQQTIDNTGQQTIDNTGQQIDNINNINNKYTTTITYSLFV